MNPTCENSDSSLFLTLPCLDILSKYNYRIISFTDTIVNIIATGNISWQDKQILFRNGWTEILRDKPSEDTYFTFDFLLKL